jgi:hypothetical protein
VSFSVALEEAQDLYVEAMDAGLSCGRYHLGPNGGILTALNLFTTKFDQVLSYVEKRAETVE